MLLQPGATLKSTEALNNTFFEGTTILITEYNQNGAVGFILSKKSSRRLNELEEFKHSPPFPLNEGGPVDKEHLYFIHKRPDLIFGGTPVSNSIYVSGDFKQAIRYINNNTIKQNDIKIFIGYCGWDEGELEAELEEGSWTIETGTKNVFTV